MRGIWIAGLVMLLLIVPSVAEENSSIAIQNLNVEPQRLFVGDSAIVTVTLYNPLESAVKVSSVSVLGSGISYDSFELGYIPPKSTHTFSFAVKAVKEGVHNVEVAFYTESGAVRSYFTLFVENRMPEISFSENVKVGEVNNLSLIISSPVEIENVVIDPLFESEPDRIILSSVSGTAEVPIRFFGERSDYEFRVSFYSGNNYHSYTAKLTPAFEEGSELAVSVSVPQSSAFLYDVVEISATITNLKDDAVSAIKFSASSNNGKVLLSTDEIAELESGESSEVTLLYSPERSGRDVITLAISYKDGMGKERTLEKAVNIDVQDSSAVDVSGVEIEAKATSSASAPPRGMFGPTSSSVSTRVEITVSGEVVNRGFSYAKNVLVYLDFGSDTEEYFVGEVEPSDSDSFSIPASGSERSVKVVVEWTNELGEVHSISKSYQLNPITVSTTSPPQRQSLLTPLNLAAVAIAAVGGVLVFRKWRSRRKNESNRAG
ncbi:MULTISPECIES: COG1361 S-layer family protein [Archaeoglobus]|jgi:hypothetical protein|uniref:S-layer domain protein n=2 Tax=Archaeoglobus fulgidus TaxID=2234 RepID=A0A075WHA8_ARCFL|nr:MULTISPECIES: COG1361 S-layer family protein [Archaeoglobus]AIG98479.1 S-layer domain protein [Archaeoglobus fulgidus DSM 8774]KUJ94414.1 MAG: hypothetical protein XD40_0350 [Archaeoglobus fulgidus]KUK07392.1 MAG: hypothetical protein XD48_0388 [Archaeoglobus fulgidus]MDI3496679.1 hypothetical protein [Archaeoglobus sp.]